LLLGVGAALILLGDRSAGAAEANPVSGWLVVDKTSEQTALTVSVTSAAEAGIDLAVALPRVRSSSVRGRDGETYTYLRIPGCGSTASAVGRPELPFKGFFIEIPYGVNASVELGESQPVSLGRGFKIHPLQAPEPDNGEGGPDFQIDAEAYATDAFLPASPVTLEDPAVIRGRRVVFVSVFPLQYNAATTELKAFASLDFRIRFDGAVDPAGETRKARLATAASEEQARRLILNYVPAEASRAGVVALQPEADAGDTGADYLIIVADHLYEEITSLAEWKFRKGWLTRAMKMSEVGTTADDVRAAIQLAYDTWTPAPFYVLLVGDSGDVPPDYFDGSLACNTDHPYACVDGTDYYPDLTLGRLPVADESACTAVVNKILTYDRTPDTGGWYEAFLSAAYFQDDDNNGRADRWFMETSAYAKGFVASQLGKPVYTAWCTNSGSHAEYHYRSSSYPHRFSRPDPVPSSVTSLWVSASAARSQITSAINAGVGLVLHRDHGSETSWGDPPYSKSNINALANGVMTPVVFSINCQTGSFHRSGGDCFCEAFIKKSSGGAVGIVGATRNSYSGHNDLLAHGIMTCFWPDYDTTHSNTTYPHTWRVAEAVNYGKYYMRVYEGMDSYTQGEFYMFHWFGDPEMMLRTEAPQSLSVSHPESVLGGTPGVITVSVEKAGAPLEGAMVAISHSVSGDLWSGTTDSAGEMTFTGIVLELDNEYDVVVTAHDAIPYEGTLSVALSQSGAVLLDQDVYGCASTVGIRLTDADLIGVEIHDVTVTTDGGDSETVELAETDPNSGIFTGTIQTGSGAVEISDGVVQVSHDGTITVVYLDADDGTGNPATVEDAAVVDCQPPVITNVQVVEVTGSRATISLETDTPSRARVRCGTSCGGGYPIGGYHPILGTSHTIEVTGLSGETTYAFLVQAWDAVDNVATDDNDGNCYSFTTLRQPDHFTEWFDAGDNDLAYHCVTFTPSDSEDFYDACCEPARQFPTDPNGGTILDLDDDSFAVVALADDARISLYGLSIGAFLVGSDGYLSITPDSNHTEPLEVHFGALRIAGLFDDLDPSAGGTVWWRQLADRVAVTFEDVPERGTSNGNSFQIELFFDGTIRLTWLGLDAGDGLVGLSRGQGVPDEFVESDLNGYGACPGHRLMVEVVNGSWGHVELGPAPSDPNNPAYLHGTEVTLTGVSDSGQGRFSHWFVYDPNVPGDPNYAAMDANNPLVILMDADHEVTAVFECGNGVEVILPMLAFGGVVYGLVARRTRRAGRAWSPPTRRGRQ